MVPPMFSQKNILFLYIMSIIIFGTGLAFPGDTSDAILAPELRLISVPNLEISIPALSPNGKLIAFVNYAPFKSEVRKPRHSISGKLWVIGSDGRKAQKLSNRNIMDDESSISWSSDSRVAFGSEGEIWIANVKSGENIPLPKPNGSVGHGSVGQGFFKNYFHSPAWSPDSTRIAMRNLYDVWLFNLGTKSYEKVFSTPEDLWGGTDIGILPLAPVWSNNSELLAFNRLKLIQRRGEKRGRLVPGIAVIVLKTKEIKSIVAIPENMEYHPVFSPDGSLMAFLSRKDQGSVPSIYIVDLKTGKYAKIASCEDECTMLSWSEDGSKIYFATNKAFWIANLNEMVAPTIEKKVLIKDFKNLSDIMWLPKGNILNFLKKKAKGKYIFGIVNPASTR